MKINLIKNGVFVTMSALLLVATAARAQQVETNASPYYNAVASLSPAGYWPMHETNTPAIAGDVETNLGTLGVVGNGYYPDWFQNAGEFVRNTPGPITNGANSDKALHFTKLISSSPSTGVQGDFTNELYISHALESTTLNPPFTVELWYYPTNTSSQTFWGQFGNEGLNGGAEGYGTGGTSHGIELVYNGSFFSTVNPGNKNISPSGTVGSTPINNWYYIVIVCDANTNFYFYMDSPALGNTFSTSVEIPEAGNYLPDFWTPQNIGGSRGSTRSAPGYIAEYAVYTNVLSTSDAQTHYNDAMQNPSSLQYSNDVANEKAITATTGNPIIYLRMTAPNYVAPASGFVALNNAGTNTGNGIYSPGTVPGILGGPTNYSAMPFRGVTNNSVMLSGISSFADAGYASIWNPTGSNASFTVSALFRGYPCDNRVECIAGHGTNSWELNLTTNGCLVFNAGNGEENAATAAGYGAANGDMKSMGGYNDGNWHQVVAIAQTNQLSIYVDGQLDTNGIPTGISTTNVIFGNLKDMMIGADPSYTNGLPGASAVVGQAGVGRQFAGQICDVAFWTNALTPSEVVMLYSNCEVPAGIIVQPQSYFNVGAGSDFTNMLVVANGSPNLSYQWYNNAPPPNGTPMPGQNASNLVLNPLTVGEQNFYYVVVTNNFGAVTSQVAEITVAGLPVFTNALPITYDSAVGVTVATNFMALYAGANPSFRVATAGQQPIGYFWSSNGVNLSAQGPTFALNNVRVLGTLNISCVASNSLGEITNIWSATVLPDPTNNANGLAPYPQQVLALNPIAYWRMNDINLDGADDNNGDNGYVCHDYAGGNDGIYTNVYIGNASYSPNTDPSDSSVQFGENNSAYENLAESIEGIDFATPTSVNAEFTVEAWVNGNVVGQQNYAPVIAQGIEGLSDAFNLGLDSQSAHNYEFYVRNSNDVVVTADSSVAPDGNWHHLVGVCDEANGVVLLYIDGHLRATNSITPASGLYEANAPVTIGAGTGNGSAYTNQFVGFINDVSLYNQALTASNVAAQYLSVGFAPTVVPPPQAAAGVVEGGTITIPAISVGTPISGYAWTDVTSGQPIPNATGVAGTTNGNFLNAALTINNAPASLSYNTLQLTLTNAYGSTNYSVLLIVDTNTPIIELQLPSPVTVVQGNTYEYSVNVDGVSPFTYQWYSGPSAGSQTPILNATNPMLTVTAATLGSTYYSVAVTNQYGGVVSATSQFITISSTRPTLTSGYGTNLMLLNPAGYWPMHETEAPAPGDTEVNYGSLGVLGTGYYPNWATNGGGITPNFPGALTFDSDTAAFFNDNIGTGNTIYTTNELYIPLDSQQTTLNPPFTVECWALATNTGGGQDVWAQCGDEGFEQGTAGGTGGNYDGIQLIYNGGYYLAIDANGVQNTAFGLACATNQWFYIVVTMDSGTNLQEYINGNPVGRTTAGEGGRYLPDSWTPITVGGGRGGTRSFAGVIDEFAVYTNSLPQSTIQQHYFDAMNAGPGQYFNDVVTSSPTIYLRMDASNYNVPPMNSWPLLFNYGSVGVNGVYTPGTVPGEMPGPITNALGASFNGLSGNVPMLSGISSYADAGYASAYNPTGPTPFSVTAMFRGNPCDDRFQNIVGHSDNSWRIAMNDINGELQCTLGTNSASVLNTPSNSISGYNDQNWHQVVEVYTPNSNPSLPGTNSLYVDGALAVSTNNVTPNGILPGSSSDVMIASDPEYTNIPAGVGRQFAGQVCEVALFTNALNAGEVSAMYAAAVNPNQIPAYIAPEPPLHITVAPGGTLSLTAGVAGTSNVGYQWQFTTNGGGTDVLQSGAGSSPLNANLTVPNVPFAWAGGQLELTATNAYGTDSTYVVLTVINTNPTNIMTALTNGVLYLSWPADHTGWQLQAQTNSVSVGISTNWFNYTPSTGTNRVIIPVNLTNGTVFYRLTY